MSRGIYQSTGQKSNKIADESQSDPSLSPRSAHSRRVPSIEVNLSSDDLDIGRAPLTQRMIHLGSRSADVIRPRLIQMKKTVPVILVCNMSVLCCTVFWQLWCVVLYCTVLYCVVLCCTVLYCVVLCCTVLHCVVLCCIVLCCLVTTITFFRSLPCPNCLERHHCVYDICILTFYFHTAIKIIRHRTHRSDIVLITSYILV